MTKFFPALAHTDSMGYLDSDGKRKIMSVRRLLPNSFQTRALMSLSFDESIHYLTTEDDGDKQSSILEKMPLLDLKEVFVDCGAFHYSKLNTPKFLNGGFVRSSSTLKEWENRHLSRNSGAHFLVCSPDHIIHSGLSEDEVFARRQFTRISAKSFFELTKELDNFTPIAVVHGRTLEERTIETKFMISLGYQYIAFGGLVPLARNMPEVLHQIAGIEPTSGFQNMKIDPESPLGLLKKNGIKSHIFGLNSPEWYRWWKRLGIDSFDGSKLSQEGAANGIIWTSIFDYEMPISAKELYRRLQIKKISTRDWFSVREVGHLQVSEDGLIEPNNRGWDYLLSARCTSPNCTHFNGTHNCDPRVTGSIEHNMGRMVLNSYVFEEIMLKIDELCNNADNCDNFNGKEWLENWAKIEVGE